jgi:glycosyltransferase involved in cell wall biosynthesis
VRVITRLNIGGPSIQAVSLSHRLTPFGFMTRLVHGRLGVGEGDMSYLLAGTGVDSVYVPSLQRPVTPADDLRAIQRVYRILCETKPAIVHTHMAKAGAVGRAATLLYNRTHRASPAKIVHTYHGHVLEGYFSPIKTRFFLRIERALARATDRIIAISPRIKEELLHELRIGASTQYAVVPLGFDLESFLRIDDDFRRTARRDLGIPADAQVVTTLGRLTAIKQHDLFLSMAARLAATNPHVVFLIAGDGELRSDLETQAHHRGIADRVRFLGWRRDLPVIYGATDVFALTSRNEGTPVALIEAMASGVPGVSTDVGGVRDVIDSDGVGLRVRDGTPESLAKAVESLLQATSRRAMGQRARETVRARFGIDRLVHDLASLYTAMLAGRDA